MFAVFCRKFFEYLILFALLSIQICEYGLNLDVFFIHFCEYGPLFTVLYMLLSYVRMELGCVLCTHACIVFCK